MPRSSPTRVCSVFFNPTYQYLFYFTTLYSFGGTVKYDGTYKTPKFTLLRIVVLISTLIPWADEVIIGLVKL